MTIDTKLFYRCFDYWGPAGRTVCVAVDRRQVRCRNHHDPAGAPSDEAQEGAFWISSSKTAGCRNGNASGGGDWRPASAARAPARTTSDC